MARQGFIFYMHTLDEAGGMVYTQHMPRKGELLRIDTDITDSDHKNGIYEVDNVMYGIPFDHHQRADVYAHRVSGLPADLSYSEFYETIRNAKGF